MKLYFSALDDERCYSLKDIKEDMIRQNISELEVIEAKRLTKQGFFYCQKFQDTGGDTSDCCGKLNCTEYVPNNGKSGRCKHYGYCYEPTDKKRIIKIKL